MLSFKQDHDNILLVYEPTQNHDWLHNKFNMNETVSLKKTFYLSSSDLQTNDSLPVSVIDERSNYFDHDRYVFLVGEITDDYFVIYHHILHTKHNVLIGKDINLERKLFVVHNNISIMKKIDALIEEQIIIGGPHPDAIEKSNFEKLIKTFPTSTEIKHYANARITRILRDYFKTMSDAQEKLETFLAKKTPPTANAQLDQLTEHEIHKFEFIREELSNMLIDFESYGEKQWQKSILQLILYIFPKYVCVLEELQIKDQYSKYGKSTKRYIDLTLVDASGNVDIVEIKKPFTDCILSTKKYRDNYVPKNELSGTIMQAEKYIFHLSKWGKGGEVEIAEKRKKELPPGMTIQITNPKAIVIIGRDDNFKNAQKFDFEIIKRKYSNIIDIMTYDDLLRRVDNILSKFRNNANQ